MLCKQNDIKSKYKNIDFDKFLYDSNTINALINKLKTYTFFVEDNEIYLNSNKELTEEYKQWFSGFVDGEGSFKLTLRDNKRYTFSLDIGAHKDDLPLLKNMLLYFNSPNKIVEQRNNIVTINFGNRLIISTYIIPILDKYPLLTKKRYDYLLWKEAFIIYNNKDIDLETKLEKISILKSKLNKYELNSSNYPTNDFIKKHININWLIGFTEAEGSFIYKTNNDGLLYQLSQKDVSENIMVEIIIFLNNLKPSSICSYNDKILPIPNKIYKDKTMNRIMVTSLDTLYWNILPHFLECEWYSKKVINFLLWSLIVILKKHGNLYTPEGLLLKTSIKNILNKRTTKKDEFITYPELDLIINALIVKPRFSVNERHNVNSGKLGIKPKL